MSITSLTAVASNGISNMNSLYLYGDFDGVAKKVSLSALADAGLSYYGASQVRSSTSDVEAVSISTTLSLINTHALYDIGGWIDSNSLGIFRVPNADFTHVQVWGGVFSDRAEWARIGMSVNAAQPVGAGGQLMDDVPAGAGCGMNFESAPIAVSSGDVIALHFFSTTANSILNNNGAEYYSYFTIRGFKRAF